MEKIKNYLIVKEELEKRIEQYLASDNENNVYKNIYTLEILKQQLINTEELIYKELNNIGAINIIAREEQVVSQEKKQIITNIDHNIPTIVGIKNGQYEIMYFNNLEVEIENKGQNKVYVSSLEEQTIAKDEIIAYLVPNDLRNIKSPKQR